MKLIAQSKKSNFKKDDTVAVFLHDKFKKEITRQIPDSLSFLKEKIDLNFFRGKVGETIFVPFTDYPNVILIGIGEKKDITTESLRNHSSNISSIGQKKKIKVLNIIPPVLDAIEYISIISSIAEGLFLADYSFNKYKSKNGNNSFKIEKAVILTDIKDRVSKILSDIEIIGDNTLLCRNLVNEISDYSNPLSISSTAKKLSKLKGVSCRVYGKKKIEKMKMGLLLAVSRASNYPPQLVVLKYMGNPKSKKSFAIVGKGITFDSGGVNLKPTGHIEEMRLDMAGAAACIYTIKAAAELKLKKNLYAVIPLCENMLSGNSYRPGDIYKAYNGTSVEIGNTDAEGRLILADALAFTEDKLKPDFIVDLATLTGACLVSLGEIIAALISPDDKLAENIFMAGLVTGDRVWRLPLYNDYNDDIKSDIADISNISSSRNAGTIIGAVFLKNFIKKTPWAHIDIAGTAWYSKQRGYRPKHATGYGVRLLIEVLKQL